MPMGTVGIKGLKPSMPRDMVGIHARMGEGRAI
jgi:hypothetical protein